MLLEKTIQLIPKLQMKVCEPMMHPVTGISLSVDCVIFGFDESRLKVLLTRSDEYPGKWSLPGSMVAADEDIDATAYRVLNESTALNDGFLEQVNAFGAVERHPGKRVVTIAYYSLVNIQHCKLSSFDNELHWQDISLIKEFAFDHRQIFDKCLQQLQKRVQEHPLGFMLLPKKFSLRDLQYLYEAILDTKMDRRNFRKKFLSMDFLIDLDEMEKNVPHRPGKLYRFDFDKYESNKKKWVAIDF